MNEGDHLVLFWVPAYDPLGRRAHMLLLGNPRFPPVSVEVNIVIRLVPIVIDEYTALGVEVLLPKTTLLAVTAGDGYIMCGALDIALLNDKLKDRGILAGRAVGVKTLDQLLDAPLESVTHEAERAGIVPGMQGRAAVARMAAISANGQ